MKNPVHSHRESAVALIIVLAMLLLLSGLIVSFMTSVSNERAASSASNNGITTRQLADSTVNLVIGQIRQATTQAETATVPTTWASQPGAIRTLSGTIGTPKTIVTAGVSRGVNQWTYRTGSNDFVFKLYSAEKMKVEASKIEDNGWFADETQLIEKWDWNASESERDGKGQIGYTDLNQPIITPLPDAVSKGDPNIVSPRYPIIDPRAKFSLSGNPPKETLNSSENPGIVDGFDCKIKDLDDKTLKTQTGTAVQYLPMPVKWLYVMRDGTMSAADSKTGRIAGASLQNPIVGRTAFWTDDESCKLNVNTASEGTYWDTPTASSAYISGNVDTSGAINSGVPAFSLMLGASQPARGEYNRYPGHPATTCLSPALGWMGIGSAGTLPWGILPTDLPLGNLSPKLINTREAILQLAPFNPNWIQTGLKTGNTSRSGSYNPDVNMPTGADDIPRLNVITKRLYTTVDELVFKSTRNDGTLKNPTPLNNDFVTPEKLEKVRFFLTATSRSPELNLFGRPRVTFWPVNTYEQQRTGFDDLFAFTSTLYKDPVGVRSNDKVFFFTRYDAKSPINDYATTPSNEPPNRNKEMMSYLQLMTGDPGPFKSIPGFGGNFATKYGTDAPTALAERNQILQMIFDYCRTVNLVDTSKRTRAGQEFHPYTPFFGKGSGYEDPIDRSNNWSGQVTPIRLDRESNPDFRNVAPYQGLGRFPTIAEVALVFYRQATNSMRAALLFEMTTPMPGYPALRETIWTKVRVDRPTLATLDGKDPAENQAASDIHLVGRPGTALINIPNLSSHDVGYGRSYLPTLGVHTHLYYNAEATAWTDLNDPSRPIQSGAVGLRKIFNNADPSSLNYQRNKTVTFYPYVSDIIPTPAANGTLKFRGGAYTIEIYSGEAPADGSNGDPRSSLVQTIHISFPEEKLPDGTVIGKIVTVPFNAGNSPLESRLQTTKGKSGDPWNFLNQPSDVIRSLEYVGARQEGGDWVPLSGDQRGDFRLGMAMREVPAAAYQPRGATAASPDAVYRSTIAQVDGLQIGHCDPLGGYYGGQNATATATSPFRGLLAQNGRNRDKKPAMLPVDVNGVKRVDGAPGDWDRGLSKHIDGAFANKVDEGNVWFDYTDADNGSRVPYYRGRGIEETGRSFFSPNRQIASAVMFGSLPTGVVRGFPWQTLLFRPDRGTKPHPGAQTTSAPADHLLLDLFNLPVVEPYAISEPFSTGGKVNLNYVLAPFGYAKGDPGRRKNIGNNVIVTKDRSYIRRDTALRGVFKSVKIMAVPTEQENAAHRDDPVAVNTAFHFDIDSERTLDAFEARFKDKDRGLFRSASEICDIDLYPMPNGAGGPTAPAVTDWTPFWEGTGAGTFAQTGDNMRERPYAHIYPRVTTKSNVFTIHMRCQAVKKVPGTEPDKFDAKKDKILGEYRGQATVERFIDPNDPELKDYDAFKGESSVDPFYRFRVISNKQFLPR